MMLVRTATLKNQDDCRVIISEVKFEEEGGKEVEKVTITVSDSEIKGLFFYPTKFIGDANNSL